VKEMQNLAGKRRRGDTRAGGVVLKNELVVLPVADHMRRATVEFFFYPSINYRLPVNLR
jgi:hypothetical protein